MEESRFPAKGEKLRPDQFTTFTVRGNANIIGSLYRQADKHYKGKVNILTDQIINEYLNLHWEDPMITCYLGDRGKTKDPTYKYNFQIRKGTRDRLDEFSEDLQLPRAVIASAALRIWVMGLK